jgi:hypothetical protein
MQIAPGLQAKDQEAKENTRKNACPTNKLANRPVENTSE